MNLSSMHTRIIILEGAIEDAQEAQRDKAYAGLCPIEYAKLPEFIRECTRQLAELEAQAEPMRQAERDKATA